MSFLSYIVEKIKYGSIEFINMLTLANRDYPYHDFESIADTEEPVLYQVGKNNQLGNNDQRKLFVSKSTAIYSGVECTIRLNSPANVAITVLAGIPLNLESNIKAVYVSAIGAGGTLYMWFEGVLPQETRISE